ncbi:hypothetical protein [Microlunatus speluncae]|uniref:hypothetical protein n=1 Tax=Microlunatus speluncae TaxID=2594267 RepID=UPI0012660F34|nr:hypothetical protein [Microlunatus speluncae]
MESGAELIDGDGVVVDLPELDSDQALEFLKGAFALETRAESNQLQIAAHWADLHSGDALARNTTARPGRERARTIGGDGTPAIGEFCVGEFAAVAGVSTYVGTRLIADALDLRHRFPQTWARIGRYEVPIWVCRRVADKTRILSLEAARYVDAAIAPYLSSLPAPRLFALLEAKIIEADPADAEARARFYQAQRFVRTGRTTDCGIKTLIARAEAGDVIMFTALCDRIAQILKLNGDTTPLDLRRSKAIGIIANPLRTIALLAQYEGRNVTDAAEPTTHAVDHETQIRLTEETSGDPLPEPAETPDQSRPASGDHPACPSTSSGNEHLDRPGRPTSLPEPVEGQTGPWPAPGPDDHPNRPSPTSGNEHDEEVVITEADLHPAEIEPYHPVDYAADLQAILNRYRITPRDLLPKTVIYLHVDRDTILNDSGVVRVEDVGPITAEQFQHWIRGKHVTITPVIDPANTPAVDGYQTSDRIKDALRMITPAEAFPYGTNTSRRIDHDHAVPYRPPPDGPPGQTSIKKVIRLGRTGHRLKTHGGWQVRTPEVGTQLWRSPHGWHFLINPAGTLSLGKSEYARTIWDTMINDFTATHHPDEIDDADEEEPAG